MSDSSGAVPLVSVVITTYNRPELLVEALESVRRQTYPDVEIVVVDDHSETPAETVIQDPSDVLLVRHEENRGANAARNTGIDESNGEFIAFLDDDDRWLPSKLARQVESFDDDEVGLVYTGSRAVDESGDVVSVYEPSLRGDVTERLLVGGYIGSFSKVMVRRSVVERAGKLDERFPSWQDREWYLRLSEVCSFDYVEEPLVVHRSRGEQISDDYERKKTISYPLFVEKHRPLAASYGRLCERRFMAIMSRTLGASALRNGQYDDAVGHLVDSLKQYPFSSKAVGYLGLALGGERAYEAARRLKQAYLRQTRTDDGSAAGAGETAAVDDEATTPESTV